MTKSDGNISDLTDKLFLENEIKTNKFLSYALVILGTLYVIIAITSIFGIIELGSNVATYLVLTAGIVNIIDFHLARMYEYNKPRLKSTIIYSTLVSCAVVFFFYPLIATFITYGPILMSALYYSQKQIRKIAIISWIIFAIGIWANVVLEYTNESMQALHAWQEITIWQYPKDVFIYYFLLHSIVFFITALLCNGIARRGKSLVIKQSHISAEVSSMEADLKTASNIQQKTLPAQNYQTDNGNICINAFMRPAKVVGGDFYDYFISGPNIVFLVADVSDKGLTAAMFMMKAKYIIRGTVLYGESLERAVDNANKKLCLDNNENMFVTLWIACINQQTGIGKYVNAGHLPPIVRHYDGSTSKIENTPNMMLGIFPDAEIKSHPLHLHKDDVLFLFSDGLTDAENNNKDFFGEKRLQLAIKDLPVGTTDLCHTLIEGIDNFSINQNQYDDMTLLTVHLKNDVNYARKELCLDAVYTSIEKLIEEVNSLLEEKKCPTDVRRYIDTTLDEIGTNICDYAYPGSIGKFSTIICIGENFFEITIKDNGIEFNPLEVTMPDIQTSPAIGGLGISLIKNLMDKVEYSRQNNENQLRMLKIW